LPVSGAGVGPYFGLFEEQLGAVVREAVALRLSAIAIHVRLSEAARSPQLGVVVPSGAV